MPAHRGRTCDGRDSRYPGSLASMSTEDFRRLGERYLRETRAYRLAGRPRFIDKMPNNFRHIGLIHLMLPNARIIDARREPMACCFSNFKQLFAQGQEFTYGLEDIARYYRTYLELMRHWDAVLPGTGSCVCTTRMSCRICEGSVRRLLEFCGLRIRARLCRVPPDRAQRQDGELRAGPPADLSRGSLAVAPLRALAGAAARGAGRRPVALPGVVPVGKPHGRNACSSLPSPSSSVASPIVSGRRMRIVSPCRPQ